MATNKGARKRSEQRKYERQLKAAKKRKERLEKKKGSEGNSSQESPG